MRRITRWSGAPWLALGLAIGALLAPAAAIGAAGLVRIVGSSGKQAQVTAANQLQTSAAGPSQFRGFREGSVSNLCKGAFTVPASKSYVMTGAVLNVYANPTPGLANWIGLFRDAACSQTIVLNNAPGLGATVIPFEPGFGVRGGTTIYTQALGGVRGEVYVHGYFVPKAAVPSTTTVVPRPTAARSANN
jgi:hypothetical protein